MSCELPIYTEIVLVVSQCVCFIFFFNTLSFFIIGQKGLMETKEKLKENAVQIAAIYFAIYILIFLSMSPLYHYTYSAVVVTIVAIWTLVSVSYNVYTILEGEIQASSVKDAFNDKINSVVSDSIF